MASDKEASLLIRIKTAGSEAIDGLKSSFGALKEIGVGVFGALSAVVVKSIADYREQEKATNSLTQAMVNNGVYSKDLKQSYLDQAAALQKVTLFGDEQVIAAQAAFTQQVKGVQLTKEATTAILDFAQAQGVDATTAAELVGKSIGTSTNALTRYGIQVTAGATETQKFNEVMTGLNKTFGGQASAATQGYGSITQLQNAISDVFETIGEKLLPTVQMLTQWLTTIATDSNQTGVAVNALMDVFDFAAKVGVVLYQVIASLAEVIGNILGTAVGTVAQVMQGNFNAIFDGIKNGVEGIGETVTTRTQATMDALDAIEKASLQRQAQNQQQEELQLQQSLDRKKQLQTQLTEDQKAQIQADFEQKIADMQTQSDIEIAQIQGNETAKEQAILQSLQKRYQNEKDFNKKMQLEKKIADQTEVVLEKQKNDAIVANRQSTFSLIAGMASSSNSTLAAIGKAAAITQIAIDTPTAISKALASAPPPFNFALAGLVDAAMAEQAAQVAGIQLAEGGVVMPRAGGVQATIAEAGQPEVVIPLDRAQEFGLGGGGNGATYVLQGPIFLGDERSAREFIEKVDRELLKLRQNGGSVSFGRIT